MFKNASLVSVSPVSPWRVVRVNKFNSDDIEPFGGHLDAIILRWPTTDIFHSIIVCQYYGMTHVGLQSNCFYCFVSVWYERESIHIICKYYTFWQELIWSKCRKSQWKWPESVSKWRSTNNERGRKCSIQFFLHRNINHVKQTKSVLQINAPRNAELSIDYYISMWTCTQQVSHNSIKLNVCRWLRHKYSSTDYDSTMI